MQWRLKIFIFPSFILPQLFWHQTYQDSGFNDNHYYCPTVSLVLSIITQFIFILKTINSLSCAPNSSIQKNIQAQRFPISLGRSQGFVIVINRFRQADPTGEAKEGNIGPAYWDFLHEGGGWGWVEWLCLYTYYNHLRHQAVFLYHESAYHTRRRGGDDNSLSCAFLFSALLSNMQSSQFIISPVLEFLFYHPCQKKNECQRRSSWLAVGIFRAWAMGY